MTWAPLEMQYSMQRMASDTQPLPEASMKRQAMMDTCCSTSLSSGSSIRG